jgi:uncharacterized protein involved in outer membrane biogenesis
MGPLVMPRSAEQINHKCLLGRDFFIFVHSLFTRLCTMRPAGRFIPPSALIGPHHPLLRRPRRNVPSSMPSRLLLAGAAGLLGLLALGFTLAGALDAGLLDGMLLRVLRWQAQRPIRVTGTLEVKVLSRHPRIAARDVTIGGPPWAPLSLGHIDALDLDFDWPWFAKPFSMASITVVGGTVRLGRDAQGLANWQWVDPRTPGRRSLAFVRALRIERTHLRLDDALRHLHYEGEVRTLAQSGPAPPLLLEGEGTLNGAATRIELHADPLATASPGKAYRFEIRARSAGGSVTATGELPEPLFLDRERGRFDSDGRTLRALEQLTGLSLIATVPYRLRGEFERNGEHTDFHRLSLSCGGSDLEGEVAIDSATDRSRLTVTLDAERLRWADLKPPDEAAGAPSAAAPPALFSAHPFPLEGIRRTDGLYVLDAREVELTRLALSALRARLRIEQGRMRLETFTARTLDGALEAQASADARPSTPRWDLTLHLAHASLAAWPRRSTGAPPIDARLDAEASLRAAGDSVRELARDLQGSVELALSPGTMRDSLAELIGLDLKGLGLTFTHSKTQTAIRCGKGRLTANDGTLRIDSLAIDTERVLIEAAGTIDLGHERYDLTWRGYPRGIRILRLRAPISIKGPLNHPTLGIQQNDAKLSLLYLGRSKQIDCSAQLHTAEPP